MSRTFYAANHKTRQIISFDTQAQRKAWLGKGTEREATIVAVARDLHLEQGYTMGRPE